MPVPLLRARQLRIRGGPPLDLTLASGEILVVQGPSGCGKSLLLRALCDLDPHDGELFLDATESTRYSPPRWRSRVMYLPSESAWWADTVGEHLPADAGHWLRLLGFETEVTDWQVHRLSSGERQRLALARALCLEPRILVLDEPTANLDRDNADQVERMLRDWVGIEQRAIVMVTHDAAQADRMADQTLRCGAGSDWRGAGP